MLCKFQPDSTSRSTVMKGGGILWNLQWHTVVEAFKNESGIKYALML
jgi:hypothetical protein